jgi:NAD(P)-dependent dehydrogenase (short-subunit alcohol dehydrogenase family)
MDLDLGDRVAVVTGAGKGVGLAITKLLAEEGAPVVASSRTTDTLEGLDKSSPWRWTCQQGPLSPEGSVR